MKWFTLGQPGWQPDYFLFFFWWIFSTDYDWSDKCRLLQSSFGWLIATCFYNLFDHCWLKEHVFVQCLNILDLSSPISIARPSLLGVWQSVQTSLERVSEQSEYLQNTHIYIYVYIWLDFASTSCDVPGNRLVPILLILNVAPGCRMFSPGLVSIFSLLPSIRSSAGPIPMRVTSEWPSSLMHLRPTLSVLVSKFSSLALHAFFCWMSHCENVYDCHSRPCGFVWKQGACKSSGWSRFFGPENCHLQSISPVHTLSNIISLVYESYLIPLKPQVSAPCFRHTHTQILLTYVTHVSYPSNLHWIFIQCPWSSMSLVRI